jgi:hypothetical protein
MSFQLPLFGCPNPSDVVLQLPHVLNEMTRVLLLRLLLAAVACAKFACIYAALC